MNNPTTAVAQIMAVLNEDDYQEWLAAQPEPEPGRYPDDDQDEPFFL